MVYWRHLTIKRFTLALGIHQNMLTKRHNWVAIILNVLGLEIRWDVHDVYANIAVHFKYGSWATWNKDYYSTPATQISEKDILL